MNKSDAHSLAQPRPLHVVGNVLFRNRVLDDLPHAEGNVAGRVEVMGSFGIDPVGLLCPFDVSQLKSEMAYDPVFLVFVDRRDPPEGRNHVDGDLSKDIGGCTRWGGSCSSAWY